MPTTLPDQYYFIGSGLHTVTFTPYSQVPTGTIPEYPITYEIHEDVPLSKPAWINLINNSEITIDTDNDANVRSYDVTMKGTLGDYSSLTDTTDFKVHLLKLDTTPIPLFVYAFGDPTLQAYTPFTYSPSGGTIPDYQIEYTLVQQGDGVSPAPPFITLDGSGNIRVYEPNQSNVAQA